MEINKTCTCCGVNKPLNEFGKEAKGKYGVRSKCKECRKIKTPAQIKYQKEYKEKNRKTLAEKQMNYYFSNHEKCKAKKKIYSDKNKEAKKAYDKTYNIKNKEEIKIKRRAWQKRKSSESIDFVIKRRLQARIYHALRDQDTEKKSRTAEYVGCSIGDLIKHIEGLFAEGMTWDNYGEWHIDHIKPCSLFNLADHKEQLECFNFSNLQPLWAIDNILKSNKYGA